MGSETPDQYGDRRDYHRVQNRINLSCERLDEAALRERLDRFRDYQPMSAQLSGVGEFGTAEQNLLLERVEDQYPEMAVILKSLIHKVDILTHMLLEQQVLMPDNSVHDVNLSASGMAFITELELEVDDWLELRIVLPPHRIEIIAYAQVVRMRACDDGQTEIGVIFRHIKESDREALIQHLLRTQSQQLRALRQQI